MKLPTTNHKGRGSVITQINPSSVTNEISPFSHSIFPVIFLIKYPGQIPSSSVNGFTETGNG